MVQGHKTPMTGEERDKWLIDDTVEYDPEDPFKRFSAEEREKIKRIAAETSSK